MARPSPIIPPSNYISFFLFLPLISRSPLIKFTPPPPCVYTLSPNNSFYNVERNLTVIEYGAVVCVCVCVLKQLSVNTLLNAIKPVVQKILKT